MEPARDGGRDMWRVGCLGPSFRLGAGECHAALLVGIAETFCRRDASSSAGGKRGGAGLSEF